jgi:predicted ATPase/DNA-binding NarL/FixJ family response regulator
VGRARAGFDPVAVPHPKGGNLPIELSSFIGREAELSQLVKLQATTRLLTLVGPGGVGTSRLALRLASARQAEGYPEGIWFVELAMVTDPCLVSQAVSDAIGIRERVEELALDAIARTLRGRRALLVLDNCEHLVTACSGLTRWLLRRCPDLDIIATSREPLDTVGDVIWRVPPLSLPASTATDLDEIAASEAIQLLVDRARRHNPTFELTVHNMRQLVSICQRLDGLPLALELVAARMGAMHEADVAARVGLGLAADAEGSRAAGRHQTLRATLDWSYQLLAEADRILLRRLAVFADGWPLHAAESICASNALPRPVIVDSLERLVARSLVMFDRGAGGGTYYLLETVKQYASERLVRAGEVDNVRRRHFAYMLRLAERQAPEVFDPAHGRLLRREQENLRAALRWAQETGSAQAGLRLATAMFPLWFFHGHLAEGRSWFEQLLALPAATRAPVGARARVWLGLLVLKQGDSAAAEALLEHALARHRDLGDADGVALALLMLANLWLWQGDMRRSRDLFAEASTRLKDLDNPGEVTALFQSAVIAVELGEVELASALGEQCRTILYKSHNASGYVLYLKGLIAAARGERGLAEHLLDEARNAGEAQKEQQLVGDAQRELGHVLMDQARHEHARASFVLAVECAYGIGDLIRLCRAIEGLARGFVLSQPVAAVRLAAAADAMRSGRGALPWPSDRNRLSAWLPDVRRRLKGSVYKAAWEAGQLLNADDAVALARGLDREVEPPTGRRAALTRREREVLMLLARAFSNRQIADELDISVLTARTHVEHILTKLRLHSRTQAAVWANEH